MTWFIHSPLRNLKVKWLRVPTWKTVIIKRALVNKFDMILDN